MNKTNNTNKLIYPELSYKIIGVLIKVHNQLGPKFQEKHYQKAIEIEFKKENINFKAEKEVDLFYDKNLIGKYRFDFVIENKIILELKVAESLHADYKKQLLSYLRNSEYRLGILANFGKSRLEYKRYVN